ncbi:MAG: MarR family transcriptional regulator [Alphaproteobacteria bacterium]|nr:MAG: MarR family transcriptional regulator [Alphaproteobacteria bacterium]
MARTDSLHVADRLHSAAIRLLRAVRVADAETGVTAPKLSALSVLVFAGPMSLTALARNEQVTAATMSKLVADLEVEGLASKRADPADKRGVRVEATAKGRAILDAGRKRRLALLQAKLSQLPREQRALLADAAELMLELAKS